MTSGLDLASLLVGAVLAVAAQSFLQLVVVPRVEARKRREDRWERDVLALGELLAYELVPQRQAAARTAEASARLRAAADAGEQVDGSVLDEARTAAQEDADALATAFRIRGRWLLHRVVEGAPRGVDVSDLGRRFDRLEWLVMRGPRSAEIAEVHRQEWPERWRERWTREHAVEVELLSALRELATEGARPPRRRRLLLKRRRRGLGRE